MMNIVLVGGGTGGHLFPALAIARELEAKGLKPYLITDTRCKAYLTEKYHFNIKILDIARPKPGIIAIPRFFIQNIKVFLGLIRFYRNIKPDLVIGFGSYMSVMPLLIAILFRIPIMLHEQNSYLGRVNRFFSMFARRIMLSFQNTTNLPKNHSKIDITGNPIRQIFSPEIYQNKNYDDSEFKILVVGGSQGAKFFVSIVPEAIQDVVRSLPQGITIKIFHQATKDYHARLTKEYAIGDKITSEVAEFFSNIADKYSQAHLVISRSGASTVSELIALRQPSILIPLPNAADNHQFYNAQVIAKAKGGLCIEQKNITPQVLAQYIRERINNRSILQQESNNLKQLECNSIVNIMSIISEFIQKR